MMEKVMNFVFYAILGALIAFVSAAFVHAYKFRGYDAIGGEYVLIACPIIFTWARIQSLEAEIKRLVKKNDSLKRKGVK